MILLYLDISVLSNDRGVIIIVFIRVL